MLFPLCACVGGGSNKERDLGRKKTRCVTRAFGHQAR